MNPSRSKLLLDELPDQTLVHTQGHANLVELRSLMALMAIETSSSQEAMGQVVHDLASAQFSMLIRAWVNQGQIASRLFAALSDERLSPAVKSILESPELHWSTLAMARACGISRATFSGDFKKISGTTPAALLTQIRMMKQRWN